MTKKASQATLRGIEKAMELFPKEVRRQERAHRHEMKIQKAFGKICLTPSKVKSVKVKSKATK